MRAQAQLYGLVQGSECLGCSNLPQDEKLKSITVEADLKKLPVDRQRERLTGKVGDVEAALTYLATSEPRCGQLGESEVRSFATAVSPEFSISFISLAAAVMTAAKLFAVTIDRAALSVRPPKLVFQFKKMECMETTTARRPGCRQCS